MIKESQEQYLSRFADDLTIVVKPFDPGTQKVAGDMINELKKVLPGLAIHFGGAAALGLAGQNDIDINVLSSPNEYEHYSPIIEKLYGPPKRKGTSIKWEFAREGFNVELYLTDKDSPSLKDQIRVFEALSNSKELRDEYEKIKLPYGQKNFKDYMRKKYEFFNKILESQGSQNR
jgi:GrpB-like predicted nucleotidyltransferase (UPF0157 family)